VDGPDIFGYLFLGDLDAASVTFTAELFAGRYRLVNRLGQGGTSDVWGAVDEQTGQQVAVKVVRDQDPGLAQRMAREAGALQGVEHPGLVRMLDTGVAVGHAYLVMEQVPGPTLSQVLRGGPLSPRRTADLGAELAAALDYVHTRGIVHRDVKPSNILFGAAGDARLADFGIARIFDTSTLTITGTTLGTVAYMAPEQLESNDVGPAADIWSLGVVLLEGLTGRRVYAGTASEIIGRRLAGPVPVPEGLPVPWKLLLVGMLDHRPDQRLGGGEVAALLSTSAFRSSWDPSRPRSSDLPTAAYDLTALAPSSELIEPASTYVMPRPGVGSPRRRQGQSRGRKTAAVALAGAVALVIALALLVGSGSKASPRKKTPAVARTAITVPSTPASSSTTSTSPTTTTPPPPTPSAALGTLVSDLTAGVVAGTVDTGIAQSIYNPAEQAVTNEASGNPNQAADQLQQAAVAIANGERQGAITAAEGTALQADLSRLATALGLSAASTPPTTNAGPSPGPVPAPKRHH
jgi:serine/threonine protein kinase